MRHWITSFRLLLGRHQYRGVAGNGKGVAAVGAAPLGAVADAAVPCYLSYMAEAKPLDALMERAASWPDEAQAELVQFMLDIEVKYYGAYRLDDEDRARIQKSLDAAKRGEFASDEEVAALFGRYRK